MARGLRLKFSGRRAHTERPDAAFPDLSASAPSDAVARVEIAKG